MQCIDAVHQLWSDRFLHASSYTDRADRSGQRNVRIARHSGATDHLPQDDLSILAQVERVRIREHSRERQVEREY